MQWLASLLAQLIGGPFVQGAVDAYKAKLQSGTDQDKLAADLAARELLLQQAEITAQEQRKIAEVGRWYEPEKLLAYIMIIYFGKVILWDKVLGLGVTDAITGDAGKWASLIMSFYVGKRAFENVATIIRRA